MLEAIFFTKLIGTVSFVECVLDYTIWRLILFIKGLTVNNIGNTICIFPSSHIKR